MFRDEIEYMRSEAEAERLAEMEAADCDDDDDFAGDDWVPGCDSIASCCDGPYDPMTDW